VARALEKPRRKADWLSFCGNGLFASKQVRVQVTFVLFLDCGLICRVGQIRMVYLFDGL